MTSFFSFYHSKAFLFSNFAFLVFAWLLPKKSKKSTITYRHMPNAKREKKKSGKDSYTGCNMPYSERRTRIILHPLLPQLLLFQR